jgi:hypothetical protein
MAVAADEHVAVGEHSRTFDVEALPDGVYFVRLVVDGRVEIAKATIVR